MNKIKDVVGGVKKIFNFILNLFCNKKRKKVQPEEELEFNTIYSTKEVSEEQVNRQLDRILNKHHF